MFVNRALGCQGLICSHFTGNLRSAVHQVLGNVSNYHPCSFHEAESLSSGFIPKKKYDDNRSPSIPVSPDLGRLLSINNKYALYQFLSHFTFTERINEEVHKLIHVLDYRTDFPGLMNVVDLYTWNSAVDEFLDLKSCAASLYPLETKAHGDLIPHQTLCENIHEPLSALSRLLEHAYDGIWPKAIVLAQIELLMNKIISSGSQCTVDKVNNFLVSDCTSEMQGQLLCSSWVSLCLSPYKYDLRVAAKILENNEQVMMPYLDKTLSKVAVYLLDERQFNRYYALLLLFSKRTRHKKMEHLLELLFKHFYNSNNFRGCTTCITLANDLKLTLTSDVLFKFEQMKKRPRHQKDMPFLF